jgi:hypothetical protein
MEFCMHSPTAAQAADCGYNFPHLADFSRFYG